MSNLSGVTVNGLGSFTVFERSCPQSDLNSLIAHLVIFPSTYFIYSDPGVVTSSYHSR